MMSLLFVKTLFICPGLEKGVLAIFLRLFFYLFSTTQPFRANVGTMVSRAIRIVNSDNQGSGPRGYLQGASSISRLSGPDVDAALVCDGANVRMYIGGKRSTCDIQLWSITLSFLLVRVEATRSVTAQDTSTCATTETRT